MGTQRLKQPTNPECVAAPNNTLRQSGNLVIVITELQNRFVRRNAHRIARLTTTSNHLCRVETLSNYNLNTDQIDSWELCT